MPTLPAPLAAGAERWFGRPVVVSTVEDLSPNVRRVCFTGPDLAGRSWSPGDEVEFRVSDRDLRHYTPSRFDRATGTFEVVFCTLAGGPGSAWARRLRPGDRTRVLGPGSGFRVRPDRRPVVLGDACTLGLFTGFRDSGLRGAVEVPAVDDAAAAALVPGLDIVPAGPEPGSALSAWAAAATIGEADCVYLVGHAQSLQRLRSQLRGQGVPRDRIRTKAYWATGRTGR